MILRLYLKTGFTFWINLRITFYCKNKISDPSAKHQSLDKKISPCWFQKQLTPLTGLLFLSSLSASTHVFRSLSTEIKNLKLKFNSNCPHVLCPFICSFVWYVNVYARTTFKSTSVLLKHNVEWEWKAMFGTVCHVVACQHPTMLDFVLPMQFDFKMALIT